METSLILIKIFLSATFGVVVSLVGNVYEVPLIYQLLIICPVGFLIGQIGNGSKKGE